ncbi:histidine phosphatase superfamily [Mycena vulgaris]|nr:histidine phosphatase superfamily [Mycena vulgaris]
MGWVDRAAQLPTSDPNHAFPSMFPTDVGYAGNTPTGAEPAVIATAPSYPVHTGAPVLVTPDTFSRKKGKKSDLFTKWGNLSPWYSMERGAFGVHSGPETPNTCRVTGLHLLHKHDARYPSAWVPRLLNFTESNTLPVFRTESQISQSVSSAIHSKPYQQSITTEGHGFNNTLAPYMTCPNAQDSSKADRGRGYLAKWASVYLEKALRRLQPQLTGYTLTIEDVYVFQQLCAYETVALGYSKFCELFTEEEWDGFEYSFDLYFWYNSGFDFPLARSQGIGYVQELVARLTHTPISTHNSSTNATLDDNPIKASDAFGRKIQTKLRTSRLME